MIQLKILNNRSAPDSGTRTLQRWSPIPDLQLIGTSPKMPPSPKKTGLDSRLLFKKLSKLSAASKKKTRRKSVRKLVLKGRKRRSTRSKKDCEDSSESSDYNTTSESTQTTDSEGSFWSDPEFSTPEGTGMTWTQFIDKLCTGPICKPGEEVGSPQANQ